MLEILYGGKSATAHIQGNPGPVYLYVALEKDPGCGSMTFPNIPPAVVRIVSGDSADILRCADQLERSASYIGDRATRLHYLAEVVRLRNMAGEEED